jgi:hypothetical protein
MVTVASTGALATIYSDNGVTPKANPITADNNGYFEFYAADGRYSLTITGSGIQTQTIPDVLVEDLVTFSQAGSGAVPRTLQDKLRDTVSPMDFGAVGDGVADDTTELMNAFASGKVVDGGGRTYGIGGGLNQLPAAFVGMQNIRLKQLNPTAAQTRSIFITGNTNRFVLRDVVIDRGGSAGYTVGDITDFAGVYISSCSGFTLHNVRVTNGGRGNGIAITDCTDWLAIGSVVDEHYWQEVNPASPVIIDDIIQAFWVNNCSRFGMVGCRALNVTSGAPGSQTTGVAANQKQRYTRWGFGGCHNFSLIGCNSNNLDQCFDLTGTLGNYDFTISDCVAEEAGTYGFKFANSAYNGQVSNCVAKNCGYYGFVISGMTEVANPNVRDIDFINCKAINTGSNGIWAASSPKGFRIMASTIDASYPRAIRFNTCQVIDNQGVPTTTGGFASDVSPIEPTSTGYNKPDSNTCVNCSVVGTTSPANSYSGIHFQGGTYVGTTSGSASTSTWTSVDLTATDIYDPAGLHSTSTQPSNVYAKTAGLYIVAGTASFNNNTTGTRKLRFAVNGIAASPEYQFAPHATSFTTMQGVAVLPLVAGDSVRIEIWQDSGAGLVYDRSKASLSIARVQ